MRNRMYPKSLSYRITPIKAISKKAKPSSILLRDFIFSPPLVKTKELPDKGSSKKHIVIDPYVGITQIR